MSINIVCGYIISSEFKRSNHFFQSLGLVATVEKNGCRVLNDKDGFSKFYNTQYRTIIYAQGKIGDIRFYLDHAIKDDNFGVYVGDNFEEFVNTFDKEIVSKKGIDFYIGHLLKMADEAYEEKSKNDELKKLEDKKIGDPNQILQNPGSVTYEDLKSYMEKKQKERYKNNNNI